MISDIDSIMKKLRGEIGGVPVWRAEIHPRVKRPVVSFRGIPVFGLYDSLSYLLLDLARISRKMMTILK